MSAIAGYAWATLAVTDLERSVAWYRQAFGLDVLMTNADTCAIGDADRFVYLVEPSSLFVLGVEQAADNDGGAFAKAAAGIAQLALGVGPGGLVERQAHFNRIGIAYRGPTAWSTGEVLELADPDGIPVLVFEPSLAEKS